MQTDIHKDSRAQRDTRIPQESESKRWIRAAYKILTIERPVVDLRGVLVYTDVISLMKSEIYND